MPQDLLMLSWNREQSPLVLTGTAHVTSQLPKASSLHFPTGCTTLLFEDPSLKASCDLLLSSYFFPKRYCDACQKRAPEWVLRSGGLSIPLKGRQPRAAGPYSEGSLPVNRKMTWRPPETPPNPHFSIILKNLLLNGRCS